MRRASKVDANQPEIVAALRRAGAIVTPMHQAGRGIADLAVSYRQRWLWIEVKSDDGELNRLQKAWIGSQRAPVYVVKSPAEAIEILNTVTP